MTEPVKEFRPQDELVANVEYRLSAFKFPSFDRRVVEALLLLIHQWKHDAHVYKQRVTELEALVAHYNEGNEAQQECREQ